MSSVSFQTVQQAMPTSANNTVSNSNTPYEAQNSFASVLQDAIDQVNNSQNNADSMTTQLINGGNVDLSQVMVAQQEANITLQTAVQVRNKVIDAYQQIMNMQV